MTEKRFKPYNLERNKTVKEWKEWLNQFDDDTPIQVVFVEGDCNYFYMDAWTSNKQVFFQKGDRK